MIVSVNGWARDHGATILMAKPTKLEDIEIVSWGSDLPPTIVASGKTSEVNLNGEYRLSVTFSIDELIRLLAVAQEVEPFEDTLNKLIEVRKSLRAPLDTETQDNGEANRD